MKKTCKKSGFNATKRHKFSVKIFELTQRKFMPENLWRLVRIKAQNAYALRIITASLAFVCSFLLPLRSRKGKEHSRRMMQ